MVAGYFTPVCSLIPAAGAEGRSICAVCGAAHPTGRGARGGLRLPGRCAVSLVVLIVVISLLIIVLVTMVMLLLIVAMAVMTMVLFVILIVCPSPGSAAASFSAPGLPGSCIPCSASFQNPGF